jgi:hypothetical protein
MPRCTIKPTNVARGHIIQLMDSISSHCKKFQHKQITNLSITHANNVMHALADCVKAQGMTGKARTSQAAYDLQHIVDATQAHSQAHPNKFEETTTPDDTHDMAPPSVPRHHINDNRQITFSKQPQSPVLRVPTNEPAGEPTSMPLINTTNNPTKKAAPVPGIKPTTLPANLSKHECL